MAGVEIPVGVDTSALATGLASIRSQVAGLRGQLSSGVAAAGSFLGIGAVFGKVKEVLDEYGRIDDLARAMGATTDEIQQLGNAAKLSGSDVETLLSAFTKAEVKLSQFTKGATELGDEATSPKELEIAWNSLGVTLEKAMGMTKTEKLLAVSEAISGMTDATAAQSIAFTIFGKSAQGIMPVLTDYEALKKSLAETSIVSKEDIANIAKLGDFLDITTAKLKALGGSAVGFWGGVFDDKSFSSIIDGFSAHVTMKTGQILKGVGSLVGSEAIQAYGKAVGITGFNKFENIKTKTQEGIFYKEKTPDEIAAEEATKKQKEDERKAALETANFLKGVNEEAEARNLKQFGLEMTNIEKLAAARDLMQKAYSAQNISDYKKYAAIVDQTELDIYNSKKSFLEGVDKLQQDATIAEMNSVEKVAALKKTLNEQLEKGQFDKANTTATELNTTLKEQVKSRKDIEKDNVISGGLRSVGGGGAFAQKVDTSLLDTNIKQLTVLQEIRDKVSGTTTLTLR